MATRPVEELDGFWACRKTGRTVHIGFEDEETVYIDLFNSAQADHDDESDCITAIILNLRTGDVVIEGGRHDPDKA